MKNNILIMAFLCCLTFCAKAQSIGPQTLNATGGSAAIEGKTYAYSIGEMTLVNTATGSNIIVTQGVLQPAPQPTGIHEEAFFNNHFNVYPNPGEDIIFLQPAFATGGQLSFQLYDALGRVLKQGVFKLDTGREKQSISLSDLAASTYSLSISFNNHNDIYKTAYKIQKVN